MRALFCLLALSFACLMSRAETPRYGPVEAMHADVARRVAAGDFEGLLQDAERYQRSQERLPDGRWRLAVFYGGLRRGYASAAHDDADWARDETALTTLAIRQPASSNAWLLLATLYESHAWAVRGGGYADTVSDASNARFHALVEDSRKVLYRHKAALANNPQWYVARIGVGGSAGDDEAELDAVFAEALRKFPNYQQTWFARLNFLTPKWGGSVEQMVALVARSAQTPSATDGIGLTARLLWIAEEDGYPDLVRQPGIDWAVVKRSYDDVLDRFPVDFNAQHFVLEACGKSDKAETAHLLGRVSADAPRSDGGLNAAVYGMCADWAGGKIPGFIMRDKATGRKIEIF